MSYSPFLGAAKRLRCYNPATSPGDIDLVAEGGLGKAAAWISALASGTIVAVEIDGEGNEVEVTLADAPAGYTHPGGQFVRIKNTSTCTSIEVAWQ